MKIHTSMLAVTLMCLSPLALANHDPDAAQMGHSRIDANGDGWISQDEFMTHQQEIWNRLPKNANGTTSTPSTTVANQPEVFSRSVCSMLRARPLTEAGKSSLHGPARAGHGRRKGAPRAPFR